MKIQKYDLKKTAPETFTPVLRFIAASDSHIKEAGDASCIKIEKMLDTAYAISSNDNTYQKLDALFMVGDTINSGTKEQFGAFFDILSRKKQPQTEFLGVIAKYHDCDKQRLTTADFTRRTGQPTDFHRIINGFHFIGISVCPDPDVFHYSDDQKLWLDTEISKAVKDTPHKPVFVFQHEHVRDTVYGSSLFDGWGEIYFSDIFRKYPNIVNISGHSHYPASDPRSVWQGEFTAMNDGGLSYFEFTFDGERKYHPENAADMAQFIMIEADKNGAVRERVIDLNADAVFCDRYIDNATDPSSFPYCSEKRIAEASVPYFTKDTKISIKKENGLCSIVFSPAVTGADDSIFLYRLLIKNENDEPVLEDKILSDYYYHIDPSDVRFSVELKSGKYTAEMIAQSIWDKKSKPLKTVFEV